MSIVSGIGNGTCPLCLVLEMLHVHCVWYWKCYMSIVSGIGNATCPLCLVLEMVHVHCVWYWKCYMSIVSGIGNATCPLAKVNLSVAQDGQQHHWWGHVKKQDVLMS